MEIGTIVEWVGATRVRVDGSQEEKERSRDPIRGTVVAIDPLRIAVPGRGVFAPDPKRIVEVE